LKKGNLSGKRTIINRVEMPGLTRLASFAALVLLCLCHPTAGDAPPPAPQPFDPPAPACQFDLGFGLYDLTALNVRMHSTLFCCASLMASTQKLGKQVLPTNIGEMYFSPCSAIQAFDCSALCCINTEGGKWQSCGFTQGQPGPLVGAEFNGVDGFQVPQPRHRF